MVEAGKEAQWCQMGTNNAPLVSTVQYGAFWPYIPPPLSGRLAEVFGRRPTLLIAIVLFAAGSAVAGSAPNVDALLVGRGSYHTILLITWQPTSLYVLLQLMLCCRLVPWMFS